MSICEVRKVRGCFSCPLIEEKGFSGDYRCSLSKEEVTEYLVPGDTPEDCPLRKRPVILYLCLEDKK
jgi:hypothetical protein